MEVYYENKIVIYARKVGKIFLLFLFGKIGSFTDMVDLNISSKTVDHSETPFLINRSPSLRALESHVDQVTTLMADTFSATLWIECFKI